MSDDFFRRTEQDARVRKVTRMLPDGPISDVLAEDLVSDAARYVKEHGVSYADLAAAIGENTTYVSNLFTGKEDLAAKTRERLLRAISNWMEEDFRHRSVRMETTLVNTIVAERLKGFAQNVKATRDWGIGYSPAGCGKTAVAKVITAEMPGTIYVRVNKSCRAETGLLRKIWGALRRTHRQRRGAPQFDEVVEELSGTGRLLIIDQAHDLKDSSLRLLMDLHDEADLPILLLGTVEIRNRAMADRDPHFGQVSSRVGLRINLLPEAGKGKGGRGSWVTPKQIQQMFRTGKLRLSTEAARLLALEAMRSADEGSGVFRRVQRIHRWAQQAALDARAAEITAAHIAQAISWVDDEGEEPAIAASEATTEREAASA